MKKIKKILAANRSEIAIRIFRAAEESGIKTAAIVSKEDRFAFHRLKTDESYLVGEGKGPSQAYLDINSIIDIWFKYNFIYSTKLNNQSWINNKSKYLIIHNSSNSEKTEIHICNPYTNIDKNNNPCNNSKIISIELLHHQFMILPFNWYYFIDDSFINLYLIHDPITLLISSCSN